MALENGKSSIYHYDGMSNTTELTDSSGTVTDTYRYNAWGEVLSRTGTTKNPHTFVGRRRYYGVPDVPLYLLGLRYYCQRVGRFLTTDPARAGTHWRIYVRNRSILLDDPMGLGGKCKVVFWIGLTSVEKENGEPDLQREKAARDNFFQAATDAKGHLGDYDVAIYRYGTTDNLNKALGDPSVIGIITGGHGRCGKNPPEGSGETETWAFDVHKMAIIAPAPRWEEWTRNDDGTGGQTKWARAAAGKSFKLAYVGHCFAWPDFDKDGQVRYIRANRGICLKKQAEALGIDTGRVQGPDVDENGEATFGDMMADWRNIWTYFADSDGD